MCEGGNSLLDCLYINNDNWYLLMLYTVNIFNCLKRGSEWALKSENVMSRQYFF